MRIAFEVDGVLADLDGALARASLTHFGVLERPLTAAENRGALDRASGTRGFLGEPRRIGAGFSGPARNARR